MESKCKFQGPAQSQFASFEDQALSLMINCCPRWNDANNPKSYMIPPIFYFRHPEKPDHELEAIKRMGNFDRAAIDRTSDDAEHSVFNALTALVNERYAAPFVVLRDFNVNRISAHLDQMFPGLPSSVKKTTFGEYDYVLMGPHIGIVVIEVKSTAFTQMRDFNFNLPKQHQRLPEQYQHGTKQLRSFDKVLDLLDQLQRDPSSIRVNRAHIRRILFTPNLQRSRYDRWFSTLDETRRNKVHECVEGIDRWFSEDATDLCAKFRSYLDDCRSAVYRLPSSLYEFCVPILTGMSSVTITGTSIDIDSEILSEAKAVLRVSGRVEAQDPWSLHPSIKMRRLERSNQTTIELLKAIILTPEQSAVLKSGLSSQFIMGAVGTGKTIIFQAKALDELRKGESVLVLCSDLCVSQYVDLFERHNLKGYSVKSWPRIRDGLPEDAVSECSLLMEETGAELVGSARLVIRRYLMNPTGRTWLRENYFKHLVGYDHILIDDAFAEEAPCSNIRPNPLSLLHAMLMMAYAGEMHSTPHHWKTVWVALDPFWDESYFVTWAENERPSAMDHLHNEINRFASSYFGISYLKRVMRNPENIFQSLLPTFNIGPYQTPVIGHKIQGSRCYKTVASYDALSKEIIDIMENVKDKYLLDQIAVILDMPQGVREFLIQYLEERNIPCARISSDESEVNNEGSCMDSDKFTSNQVCKPDRGKLGIYKCDQVHSLEWPLVIYVAENILFPSVSLWKTWQSIQTTFEEVEEEERVVRYRKYLASSRAMGMLIEIDLE